MPMLDVTARRGRAAVLAGVAAAALAVGACASVPAGRSAVDVVDILGAHEVAAGDVEDKLATTASPKFLGLFRGVVFDYSIFDASTLQRDLARVERYYRGKGFFEAHARTARVIPDGPGHVRVEIVVEEGTPTLNRRIQIDGLETLPAPIADEARAAIGSALPEGSRFDEDAYKGAQTTLTRALTDDGYAYAKVEVSAEADLQAHVVDYTFKVEPGPATTLGPVTIVSVASDGSTGPLGEIDEKPVRRALHLREGAAFSTSKIESATQALLDLKVFSAVDIVPGLTEPPSEVVPLTVKVTPTKLRSLRLGGGVELDEIKTDIHGLIGWEDYNFLGGLRDFSVNFSPGVVVYPVRVNNLLPQSPPPLQGLLEEHLRAELRQSGFIEARTSLFVRPEINVYPLLVPASGNNPNPDIQVVGYVEPRAAVGVDRRFGRHFSARFAHNVQAEFPFSYHTPEGGQFDQSLPGVLLSYPQLVTTLDFRDDQVHPHFGFYLSNDLQVAGLGGNAQDIRISPEARGYIPIAKNVTLAARASLGFLFASNYGGYVHHLETSGSGPAPNSANLEQYNNDIEIAYFRGFFSGGPGSNRGFPVRGIAPHGVVPFLNPTTQGLLQSCGKGSSCAVPIGGFTQWESSIEVRFDVSGPFGAATFCDAADVSGKEVDIRLNFLHLACGVGVRYATPVGPIRLDVGYRIQPLQVLGYPNETAAAAAYPTFGTQPLTANTLPLAFAFGLGEAF